MPGLEVVRRLRADPKTKHALFAVCTATDIDELEEDFAGEVDLFLSKPITNGDVDELLNRLAARRARMVFGSEENVP
jgi:CheY-like chemotaxis protein